ncbi:MAG: 2-C-methyl-D-erythritol 4-phosphate cytidylyltransferase [Bacillales bacterium]|jgi:2-C-methyl-D-erythritol 4-phosphate cytidylyltransferase|nr:2-C-methyl-D-erythritol 4-phosphate cytidylyltransferase [Bacillales bacterium]
MKIGEKMHYEVIIPAAGSGKRMGEIFNKLFIDLDGKTIIQRTVEVFLSDPYCRKVILAIKPEEKCICDRIFADKKSKITYVNGGSERQYSVRNGLEAVSKDTKIILVHDGARPFINHNQIQELVECARKMGSTVLAVRVKDTIKKTDGLTITETVERDNLWSIQTPQAFRTEVLKQAHSWADETGYLGTDDSSLVEKIGLSVSVTEGNYENIKITTKEDILFAEAILKKRSN